MRGAETKVLPAGALLASLYLLYNAFSADGAAWAGRCGGKISMGLAIRAVLRAPRSFAFAQGFLFLHPGTQGTTLLGMCAPLVPGAAAYPMFIL